MILRYRGVAEVIRNVVFSDPSNKEAKELLAEAYEQMDYPAEGGLWRSISLQGASEPQNGAPTAGGANSASPDTIKATPPEMTFDFLAVRLNGQRTVGKKIVLDIEFTDLDRPYTLIVENGDLNYARRATRDANARLILTKSTLDRIQLGDITPEQAITSGDLKVEGKCESFVALVGLLDRFPFWFNGRWRAHRFREPSSKSNSSVKTVDRGSRSEGRD